MIRAALAAAKARVASSRVACGTVIGVNLLTLEPGAWSSQRHWHTEAEEFIFVVEGEVMLVTGAGEELLRAGDSTDFPPGEEHSQHLQNRSSERTVVLEVGPSNLRNDVSYYPGLDVKATAAGYFHSDGTPY